MGKKKFHLKKIITILLILLLTTPFIYRPFLIPSLPSIYAATTAWDFTNSSDYTFDDTKIEFSAGQAQLKETSNWYNTSWTRRKLITISGSADGAQTNYQLKVTVTYDADMQADFDDVRFTSSDGVTLIDHWLESKTDSTTADFWVEVPLISASPDETTIYLYYNNSSASSVSSGANTFISGTDFNQDDSFSYNEGGVAEDYGDQDGNIKSGVFTNGIGETWDSQLVLSNGRLDAIEYLGNGVLLTGSRLPTPGHIYKSIDYGENWTDKGAATSTNITNITSAGSGVAYFLTGTSYLYSTDDYGENWTSLGRISNNSTSKQLSYGLIVLDSGTMLISDTATGGGHIFRSTNNGVDWTDLGVISTAELYRFEETGDGVIINGWAGNIYKSTNDGVDWVDKGHLIDDYPLYATEYLGNGILLQGADNGNIFRSIDNGENWTDLGIIGDSSDDFVYLGNNIVIFSTYTGSMSLYRSTDAGLTWSNIGSLLSAGDSMEHEIYVNDNGYEFGLGVTNKGYIVKSITGTPEGMVKKINLDRTANSFVKKQLTSSINTNFAVRTKVRTISTSNDTYWLPVVAISTTGERGCSTNDNYSITLIQRGNLGLGIAEFKGADQSPCYSLLNQLATSMNTDYTIEIRKTAATTAEVYIYNEDGTLFGNNSLTIADKNYNYLMAHQATPTGWGAATSTQNIDYIFIRNYTSNEPTHAINAENTLYDITNPSVNPNSSIAQTFTSLSGFTETATKNEGEIKYVLSNDDGSTWYYYNSDWVASDETYSQANTATEINTNIATFPTGDGNFLFKAYLHSDGSQLVQLDNITLTYNTAPSAAFDNDFSAWESGNVTVNYNLIDEQSDTCNISQTASSGIEYSTDNSTWFDATDAGGVSEGLTGLTSASAPGTNHIFVWDSATDLPDTEDSTVYLRIRPNDDIDNASSWTTSSAFGVDNLAPSSVGAPTFGTITTSSIEVNKPSTVTESGSGLYQWQVRRDGTTELGFNATSTTSVTDSSLSENTQYTYDGQFKDNQSNTSSYGTSAQKYTLADTPTNLALTAQSTTQIDSSVDTFTNNSEGSSGYYFANTTQGTNSGWQSGDNTWSETDLSPNTQYTYTVKYRNGDGTETSTIELSKYTLADTPTNLTSNTGRTTMILIVDSFPNNTAGSSGYYFANTTQGTNSGWIQTDSWTDNSLACNTSYTYTVKYRNGDGTETSTISLTASTFCGLPTPITVPGSSGLVSNPYTILNLPTGGSIQVNLPTVLANSNALIVPQPNLTVNSYPAPQAKKIIPGKIAEIQLWQGLQQIRQIDTPATITFTYDDQDLQANNINESMLKIYYWNEDQHNWLALDNNIVDSTNNKVTASTYHFTLFALIGQLSTSSTNTKLYKTQGDPKVYLITPNNYRRHIPDEKSFLSYGFLWNQITTVLADYLDNFPISNLIKLANNPKVYLINDRIKLWIVNEQIFNGLGLNWSAISTVNQTEFDAYQTGEPIETLEKSVTQSSGQFTSFLTIGSIGDEVRRLQQKLKDLGYFNYPSITGYFGPVTAEAVKVFQSANGIEMVGYVGPKTRQALNK